MTCNAALVRTHNYGEFHKRAEEDAAIAQNIKLREIFHKLADSLFDWEHPDGEL